MRRRRASLLAALAAGALAAATVATIGVVRAQSDLAASTTPAAPLTEGDVRSAVDAFAGAVAREDSVNLLRVLSPGVQRVFPSDVQRGRGAVMSAYRGQFRASAITGYDIGELQVQGGRVGRASGRYTLERAGRRPVTGRIVLDVVRVRGTPRIGLIAATPD